MLVASASWCKSFQGPPSIAMEEKSSRRYINNRNVLDIKGFHLVHSRRLMSTLNDV